MQYIFFYLYLLSYFIFSKNLIFKIYGKWNELSAQINNKDLNAEVRNQKQDMSHIGWQKNIYSLTYKATTEILCDDT